MSDIVVIGCGADELVCAHTLARAGCRVTRIDRGAPGDRELDAGWLPQRIARELELERHGLRATQLDPWAVAVAESGEKLELWCDVARSSDSIGRFSAKDAARWPAFCDEVHAFARLFEHLYLRAPPDPTTHEFGGLGALARAGVALRGLGRARMHALLRSLPMSIADFLDEWFESETLKGVLAGAGVMHLCQGPRSSGTAFVFLHHHVGSPRGVFRPALTNARAVLNGTPGITTHVGELARIELARSRAAGVVLTSGETIAADVVVSGLDPHRTLLELADPAKLDPQLVRALRHVRHRGVVSEVRFTLNRAAAFTRIVEAPSLEFLERAYDDVKYGRTSSAPYVEAWSELSDGAPSVRASVQYTPYALREAHWSDERRSIVARHAIAAISKHAQNFEATIVGTEVLTPRDLERARGYPGGQAYHAELALDQIFWMRPVPELAHYRAPFDGLYLCGPAMHPGAGVIGAAGLNAARTIVRDLRKRQ